MALTQAQLNSLYGVNDMTPDQSSAALGHANSQSQKLFTKAKGTEVSKSEVGGILPTIGAVGGGIAGAAGGALVGGPVGAYAGGVAGSGAGAALGEAANEGLNGQKLQPKEIAKQGAINAAMDAIGGPILSGLGKVFGGVAEKAGAMFGGKAVADTVEKVVAPPIKVATKRISATADMLTKNELAQEASRVTPKGQLLPSDTEKRAGELLAGKTFANPTKTLTSVKNEIATRGKEAEQFLGENGKPISNEEDLTMFQTARDKAAKYLTPAQLSGYDHAITQFQGELRGMGNMNTGTYYKALKNFEENVTANLPKGKEALLSDTSAGQITGAKTVRKVVRDMIGSKNPEFKGKMFDLASLYDAADNVSTQVANLAKKSTTFAKRHPVVTGAAKYGAEAVGAGALYEGAKEIGAPLP